MKSSGKRDETRPLLVETDSSSFARATLRSTVSVTANCIPAIFTRCFVAYRLEWLSCKRYHIPPKKTSQDF